MFTNHDKYIFLKKKKCRNKHLVFIEVTFELKNIVLSEINIWRLRL